jgi:hypothetical protein
MNIVYQTKNANTPSLASATTAIVANEKRRGWFIQNQGTNPVYVLLGSGATTSVFHVALKACTAVNDGVGGTFSQTDGTVYTGVITVAGTALSYTVLEMAP